MLTPGLRKSNCPNNPPSIPPGAPEASRKAEAAFATLIIFPADTAGRSFIPFPNTNTSPPPNLPPGATQSTIFCTPSKPSAFPLKSLTKLNPPIILPTAPRSGANSLPILSIILLNKAPVN